jgi:hypothetical protein
MDFTQSSKYLFSSEFEGVLALPRSAQKPQSKYDCIDTIIHVKRGRSRFSARFWSLALMMEALLSADSPYMSAFV